jgi:hypothetical protein
MSATDLAERPTETPREQAFSDPAKGKGRRLTKREVATCLQLFDAGKTGAHIAEVLRCHESTVSRTLDAWCDDRPLARRYLESNSLKLAKTVVQSKDAATTLRALGKLDIVREDNAGASVNIGIAIGQPGQSLSPPVIEIRGETSEKR